MELREDNIVEEKDIDVRPEGVTPEGVAPDDQEPEICEIDIGISRADMSDDDYIWELEQKLGRAMAEVESCTTLMQRLQADFDNYRRRNATLSEEMKQLGEMIVIEKMLTVLDNCDLARQYLQDEASIKGFNMMESQILDALEGFGLETIKTEDADFDAKLMNAVERVKCEDKQGKVVEVLAKGYLLNGKLLRPASVKVGYWE